MLTPEQERALIERILKVRASGQGTASLAQAQEQLFAECRRRVVSVCRRIMGNAARAEEIAHDALVKAWEKLERFEFRSRFATYVIGIAYRLAMDSLKRKTEVLVEDELFTAESTEKSVLADLTEDELRRFVRGCLSDLDQLDQDVAYLRYGEELPYEAIERILEIDREERKSGVRGILRTMKSRLQRRIRQRLDELGLTSSIWRP